MQQNPRSLFIYLFIYCLQHAVCVMADGEQAVIVQGHQGDLLL